MARHVHRTAAEVFAVPSSRLAGFFKRDVAERTRLVAAFADLTDDERALLCPAGGLTLAQADAMIENVIGVYGLPLGIATNMVVNGQDVLVPMAVEEPSVVAGLSFAARLVREGGGFHAATDEPQMIGQLQVLDLADAAAARLRLLAAKGELLAIANDTDPVIVGLGGGARDLEVRLLPETRRGRCWPCT